MDFNLLPHPQSTQQVVVDSFCWQTASPQIGGFGQSMSWLNEHPSGQNPSRAMHSVIVVCRQVNVSILQVSIVELELSKHSVSLMHSLQSLSFAPLQVCGQQLSSFLQ